jgi:succinoglycan biosynthesis protein ExoA
VEFLINNHKLPFGVSHGDLPSITVVIPILNEAKFIINTLNQLESQEYPTHLLEVIVVDGGSNDGSQQLVLDWISSSLNHNVVLLNNPSRLSSAARNIGVKVANGEFVLFIDAHVFVPNNKLLFSMGACARRENAKILARSQPLNPPLLSLFQEVVADVRSLKIAHSKRSYIYSDYQGWVDPLSVGIMYHCSLFNKIGYFDESFDAAEDIEFNFRLKINGYRAFISPDFSILYYPRKDFVSLFKQMFRYGFGREKFMNKHPQALDLEILAPVLALIALIIFIFVVPAGYLLGFLLLGYSMASFLFWLSLSKRRHAMLAPFVLLSIYLGLSCGIMVSSLSHFKKNRDYI